MSSVDLSLAMWVWNTSVSALSVLCVFSILGYAILCRDSKRWDSGIDINVINGCVNAKRPLNIEQASVKWIHLLLELALLSVSLTRRATDTAKKWTGQN